MIPRANWPVARVPGREIRKTSMNRRVTTRISTNARVTILVTLGCRSMAPAYYGWDTRAKGIDPAWLAARAGDPRAVRPGRTRRGSSRATTRSSRGSRPSGAPRTHRGIRCTSCGCERGRGCRCTRPHTRPRSRRACSPRWRSWSYMPRVARGARGRPRRRSRPR